MNKKARSAASAPDCSAETSARIMVVEDEALVARDLRRRLERIGYEVIGTCGKPTPARTLALEQHPDLILMDINLNAEIDGIDLSQQIRTQIDVPVVFCTAYSDDEVLARATGTTPYGYVLKPFDDRELEIAVEIALYRHRSEQAQLENAKRLEAVLNAIDDGVIACDPEGQVFLANPQAERWLRRGGDQAIGQPVQDLLRFRDIESGDLNPVCTTVLEEHRTLENDRQLLITAKQQELPIELTATQIEGKTNLSGGAVFAFRDISRRLAYEEEIERNAFFEPLTGLPNRRLFMDRLDLAFRRSQRERSSELAVMFVDLDRFQSINEAEGHDRGDEVLRLVAGRITGALRDTDTVTRFSADTFVCLLDRITDPAIIRNIASKIQGAIAQPFDLGNQPINLTASVGTAISSHSSYRDNQDIVRDADAALHQAKQAGPASQVIFEAPMRDTSQRHFKLSGLLKHAIDQGMISVHYQPIVRAHSGKLVKLEALARWGDKELGVITPGEFIPLAEKTGLIQQLGHLVLDTVCQQIAQWEQDGSTAPVVGVNLSPAQFAVDDLVTVIHQTLNAHNVDPRQIEFEVTESAAMDNLDHTVQVLNRCAASGIQISIDDFGTGYSSLAYLKRMPFNTLKIDRSFVTEVVHSSEDQALVKGIIAMAHELNLQVLAEGVETGSQADLLRKFGCDYLQGYLFGKPVPAAAIEPLIKDSRTLLGQPTEAVGS
ncbi:MAG: EAL domain-containing protein [Pseudomonadota bacterium]